MNFLINRHNVCKCSVVRIYVSVDQVSYSEQSTGRVVGLLLLHIFSRSVNPLLLLSPAYRHTRLTHTLIITAIHSVTTNSHVHWCRTLADWCTVQWCQLTFRSFHFRNVSSVTFVRFCDVRAALWKQQHSADKNAYTHTQTDRHKANPDAMNDNQLHILFFNSNNQDHHGRVLNFYHCNYA